LIKGTEPLRTSLIGFTSEMLSTNPVLIKSFNPSLVMFAVNPFKTLN